MIKDVLIPEKVGTYHIFPKRVVGFDIDKTNVAATKVYLKGNFATVENCINEKLELGNKLTHDEKVVNAIKNIINSIGRYDEIYTAIPSSQVVFKSLKLPFLSHNKIKMVINYEVEPLLPFSLDEAVIDFVITGQNLEEKSSEVMVAAVQKSAVARHVKLFEDAGVSPSKVLVDIFSLYALYKKIPAYAALKEGVALVDIGFSDTKISYIYNGRLAFVRTLPKGIFSLAKNLSQEYEISQSEAVEVIMRFGDQKPDDAKHNAAADKVFANFFSEIKFTFQSFSSQIQDSSEIKKILLLGQGARILGISEFVGKFLDIPCELFTTKSLVDQKIIKIKNSLSIPKSNILSLGIALPSDITDKFNLYRLGVGEAESSLITKQLIIATVMVVIIFLLLFLHSFMQVRKLKNEVKLSQNEAISILQEKLNLSDEDVEGPLEDVVENSEAKVKEQEDIWGAFSKVDRATFLQSLLALYSAIDRKGMGLQAKRIFISAADDKIDFSAKVKGFPELRELEKRLRKSELFKSLDSPQETEFSIKIDLAKKL